jgi:hypothetical protein
MLGGFSQDGQGRCRGLITVSGSGQRAQRPVPRFTSGATLALRLGDLSRHPRPSSRSASCRTGLAGERAKERQSGISPSEARLARRPAVAIQDVVTLNVARRQVEARRDSVDLVTVDDGRRCPEHQSATSVTELRLQRDAPVGELPALRPAPSTGHCAQAMLCAAARNRRCP